MPRTTRKGETIGNKTLTQRITPETIETQSDPVDHLCTEEECLRGTETQQPPLTLDRNLPPQVGTSSGRPASRYLHLKKGKRRCGVRECAPLGGPYGIRERAVSLSIGGREMRGPRGLRNASPGVYRKLLTRVQRRPRDGEGRVLVFTGGMESD